MNPFLRYLADKNSAHRQTHRQTDRHTPMTTRPCGLWRAGNDMALCTQHGSRGTCAAGTVTVTFGMLIILSLLVP